MNHDLISFPNEDDEVNTQKETQWISMSNALTRAGHGLTLGEKRIMSAALAQLDSKRKPLRDERRTFRLNALDYAAAFGVSTDTAYTQLKEASKKLRGRYISFHDPAFIRKGKPLKTTQMNWIGSITYHDGQGWVELTFNPDLLPHVMGLTKNFSSYQLEQASALRSVYSWKLLELLTRFQSTGWAHYSIEDFCASMEATEKQQSDFNNIKRRIIEPAIKELTEKDNWIIKWQPIKSGRKVTALRFDFERNPQERLF
jgi:plasmid replication initiation protein